MPLEKRQRIEELNFADHKPEKSEYPPEKYKTYLACPFSKHNPDYYVNVNNACTQPRGFKDIGDLKFTAPVTLSWYRVPNKWSATTSKESILCGSDASSANRDLHNPQG